MNRRTLLLSGLVLTVAAATLPARRTAAHALPRDTVADYIGVEKGKRRLTLWHGRQALKTYRIALGFGEPGPKRREGDGRTPEGRYTISGRNPDSAYHLALRISYPEPHDIAAATANGWAPGGDIMIHGLPNGLGKLTAMFRRRDWTAGCIAVTNAEIEEIWRAVPDGTPIEIRP